MITIFNKFVIDINNLKINFFRNQSQNIIEGIIIQKSLFTDKVGRVNLF